LRAISLIWVRRFRLAVADRIRSLSVVDGPRDGIVQAESDRNGQTEAGDRKDEQSYSH